MCQQQSQRTRCLGVRGAIAAQANTAGAILAATDQLLTALVTANGIEQEDVGAVFFTTTTDLTAAFPAVAARQLGWTETAFLCGHEMEVAGGPPRVIRVMIMWNTDRTQKQIEHVYLGEARQLRPDRSAWVSDNGQRPALTNQETEQNAQEKPL